MKSTVCSDLYHCNRLLGAAKDTIEVLTKAIAYLRKHSPSMQSVRV